MGYTIESRKSSGSLLEVFWKSSGEENENGKWKPDGV
jgi:hypothetical protein